MAFDCWTESEEVATLRDVARDAVDGHGLQTAVSLGSDEDFWFLQLRDGKVVVPEKQSSALEILKWYCFGIGASHFRYPIQGIEPVLFMKRLKAH